jgi:phosphoenolpyruvate carboxykinase (GTP)
LLYRPGYDEFVNNSQGDFLRVLHSSGKLDERMTSADHQNKRIYIDSMDNTIYSVNSSTQEIRRIQRRLAFSWAIR